MSTRPGIDAEVSGQGIQGHIYLHSDVLHISIAPTRVPLDLEDIQTKGLLGDSRYNQACASERLTTCSNLWLR